MQSRHALIGALLLACVAACAQAPPQQEEQTMRTVRGTVTYRERIALPPSATLQVQVADVSLMDVPATVLAERRIDTAGRQVPFEFSLEVPAASVQPQASYAVQARIEADGRLLFISDRRYAVLTRGTQDHVDIVLRAVGPPTPR